MSMEIMASLFCSSILAAVTYWLPGPRILSTWKRRSLQHSALALAPMSAAMSRRHIEGGIVQAAAANET